MKTSIYKLLIYTLHNLYLAIGKKFVTYRKHENMIEISDYLGSFNTSLH